MAILKPKIKRQNRINADWWINDWSAKTSNKNDLNNITPSREYPSNIVMKSNTDSIEMIKTKNFLSESILSSKGIDGTIILGSTVPSVVPELNEILLNIQPLGWVYIPGGRKNENQ
jgi:hypothetical protein